MVDEQARTLLLISTALQAAQVALTWEILRMAAGG